MRATHGVVRPVVRIGGEPYVKAVPGTGPRSLSMPAHRAVPFIPPLEETASSLRSDAISSHSSFSTPRYIAPTWTAHSSHRFLHGSPLTQPPSATTPLHSPPLYPPTPQAPIRPIPCGNGRRTSRHCRDMWLWGVLYVWSSGGCARGQ